MNSPAYLKITLFACLYSIVMPFCMDIYVAALPVMAHDLHITQGDASNLTFYMLLGVSLSIPFYGPLSDRVGRKKVILFALLIDIIGNFLSYYANNLTFLIVGRIITGIGAGGAPVIARVILSDSIKDNIQFTKSLSWYAMASSLSPALAPIIGGWIFIVWGWKENFLFLTIFTSLIFFLTAFLLDETTDKHIDRDSSLNFYKNYISLFKDKSFLGYSILSGLIYAFNIFYLATSPFIYQHYFNISLISDTQ